MSNDSVNIFVNENQAILKKFYALKSSKLSDYEKIDEIHLLIERNNTIEEIVLEYLLLNQKIKNKNLYNLLEQYEDCINEELFNSYFGNLRQKLSSFKKIKNLLEKLNNLSKENDYEKKLKIIIDILDIKANKYKQTFPIFYFLNKELYFNSFYYLFLKAIKNNYNILKCINEKIDVSTVKNNLKKKINDLNIKILLTSSSEDKIICKEKIEELKKMSENVQTCLESSFFNYINNLSSFISEVYDNFGKRFTKIFSNPKFEINDKTDLNLFTDFFIFLINFSFQKDDFNFHSEIWKDSLIHIPANDINYYNNNKIIMKLVEKNLEVYIKQKKYTIENIDNYCIEPLIYQIIGPKTMNAFDLNNFIRIDKYDDELFIKKHWGIFSNYICDILCSLTIFQINTDYFIINGGHCIINRPEILRILNDIRFFNFQSDFTGLTKKRFLLIYVQGFLRNNYPNANDDIIKLIYLGTILIVFIHEIIGHLNLRIQNYLDKTKKIEFPTPNHPSYYAKGRGKESGEFLEELLFGNYDCRMTIFQIIFILNVENYNVDYKTFKSNFEKCNNSVLNNIPLRLRKIFKAYEIDVKKLNTGNNEKYQVSKILGGGKIIFPQHHSLFKIDSDDEI